MVNGRISSIEKVCPTLDCAKKYIAENKSTGGKLQYQECEMVEESE